MDKKISELDQALQINNDAVFPMSQDNAGEPTTFKAGITQLGTEIAEDMTFSNLQTTSKKLVGAINELLSLGSPIIIGTTAPTSSIGTDGNIYVQYTAGIGGADDTVDGIFVKIDGAWCEISTGGGGGTTDYEDLSNKPQVNSVELVGNKTLDDLGIMPASLSKTVSGSIAHITDGADNIPVKSLVSEIVAVESGNGQPKSPTNPYTISGFDSGIVTRCGKNLFDGSKVTTTNTSNWGVSYDSSTNILTIEHKTTYGSGMPKFDIPSFVGDLVISGNFGATIDLYMNGSWVRSMPSGVSFTCTSGNKYSLLFPNNSQSTLTYKVQLEIGDTSSEFEQYNGNTYTFAFGQTVYGGHFDNKGNLVVTHGFVDLGTLDWINEDDALSGLARVGSNQVVPLGAKFLQIPICTHFEGVYTQSYSAFTNGKIGFSNSEASPFIRARATEFVGKTNAEIKALMTGAMLVYELATPTTLSITSQDIPTLLGENNIFSNCGDVEVNYYTDNADEIVEVLKATASTPLHHYSEDEQIIGTWIDGKPLYERVIDLGADTNISYDSWTLTTVSLSEIDRLVLIQGLNSTGAAYYGDLYGGNNNGYLQLLTGRNGTYVSVRYLIFRYTKTST